MNQQNKLRTLQSHFPKPEKILMACCGFILLGLGVAAMRAIYLGVDPFGALAIGLSIQTGLTFGMILLLLHIPVFIVMLCKARRLIGAGTIIGMFGIGFVIDFFYLIIQRMPFVVSELHLALRLVLLAIALVVFAFGIALYMVSDIGMVPFDAIGVITEDLSGGRIKFRWVRLTGDVLCAGAAFLLGATLGVATIVTAFCLGPLISFFRDRIRAAVECNSNAL